MCSLLYKSMCQNFIKRPYSVTCSLFSVTMCAVRGAVSEKIKMNGGNSLEYVLATLNGTQKESVFSTERNLQILAGPGSGKTKVLTCRVAHFVVEKGIPPKNIIVVTFTNKAASEMKQRLCQMIGETRTNHLIIGTFHAICCRILRHHAKMVDLDANFTVADNELSKNIIKDLRKDKLLKISSFTRNKMDAGAIWGLINKAKNKGETCEVYAQKYGDDFKTKDISTIFTCYEAELKKLNLVDFDNLLIKACELLQKKNDVLRNVEAILVDEDTNIVQYNLIKLMAMQGNNKTVTIVGDPDQSIYGFRSAEPENFIKMQKEYSATGVINMEQNYRSTGTILRAALHVISHDSNRLKKSLHTDNPEGKPILLIKTSDESAQAQFVAKEILKVINGSKGLINYKDIAVLMRMNVTSQQFEQTFRSYKIPFTIVGGDRFFDRVEIKDILSYLNFAYNPKDFLSFKRIINVPKRGIGDVNLEKILKKNEMDKTDLLETVLAIGMSKSSSFSHLIKKNLLELGNVCSTVKKMMDSNETIPNIIRFILAEIKYLEYLKERYFQDHDARWSNVGQLISIAQKQSSAEDKIIELSSDDEDDSARVDILKDPHSALLSGYNESQDEDETDIAEKKGGISEFLEYCSLCSNQKEFEEAEGGKVVITTLHSSKGLEWPCVFIATCNDGVIPHIRSESKEEECRLLYVGMTRSKFLLYCISPKQRDNWGGTINECPSRFLTNMSKSTFATTPHEWNEEMRKMMAETLGKSWPIHNDFGDTKKRFSESFSEMESSPSKKQRMSQ